MPEHNKFKEECNRCCFYETDGITKEPISCPSEYQNHAIESGTKCGGYQKSIKMCQNCMHNQIKENLV